MREPYEYRSGTIAGALNIPFGELVGRLAELNVELPIVTVCNHGNRSGPAMKFLTREGFHADVLSGRLTDWQKAGFTLHRTAAESQGHWFRFTKRDLS